MTSAITNTPQRPAIAGGFLLVLLLVCVAGLVFVDFISSRHEHYSRLANALPMLAHNMVSTTRSSLNNDHQGFASLAQAKQQFAQHLDLLSGMADEKYLLYPVPATQPALQATRGTWQNFSMDVQTVLEAQTAILGAHEANSRIRDYFSRMQVHAKTLMDRLPDDGATPKQVFAASEQMRLLPLLATRLNNVIDKHYYGDNFSLDGSDELNRDFEHFSRLLDAMQNGNRSLGISKLDDRRAQAQLAELQQLQQEVAPLISQAINETGQLSQAQLAAQRILSNNGNLFTQSQALANLFIATNQVVLHQASYGLGGFALLLIILLSFRIKRHNSRLERFISESRDDEAMTRLVNEIGDLANGDLSIHASNDDQRTAAIAEAINYAVENLRHLVATINQTTGQLSETARHSQDGASHLADASDQQAEQIMAVTSAVKQMADSIDTVSINADRSSEVAASSLELSKKGAVAVQDAIQGMDNLREQIQATAKRIKRLGESSQEIANMVELINDIADQTNILALNAAIQASMAGESGHGFAVVADQVQGLAEKSTDATRQIESLVNTILADTHEAVASMEQSTAQVVSGTNITQNAGVALTEIENISNLLADLNQSISTSAQQQAAVASSISASMNVIEKVTTENLSGTNKASASIAHLADLADQLRQSVAGFTLPATVTEDEA